MRSKIWRSPRVAQTVKVHIAEEMVVSFSVFWPRGPKARVNSSCEQRDVRGVSSSRTANGCRQQGHRGSGLETSHESIHCSWNKCRQLSVSMECRTVSSAVKGSKQILHPSEKSRVVVFEWSLLSLPLSSLRERSRSVTIYTVWVMQKIRMGLTMSLQHQLLYSKRLTHVPQIGFASLFGSTFFVDTLAVRRIF